MSLRLRALRLRAFTADGEYGRDLHFDAGLVVLRAENSMGKTTATNSMLFALGMEGLIAQSHKVPLPPVMTSRLMTPQDREVAVSESRVLLEVENHDGDILTFERFAKRQDGDTRLVRIWNGARVTAPTPEDTFEDALARVVGSGTGELGVGPRVERFVGWELPTIVMPDGDERRLYPELVLPLMFVEQRGGWRGIQAGMPSTYGIPDVRKRAREFVLGLGVYERERKRLHLRHEKEEIRRAWVGAVQMAGARLTAHGLRIANLAETVDLAFDEDTPLRVVDVRSGRSLASERAAIDDELANLESHEAQSGNDVAPLNAEEARLAELDVTLQTVTLELREHQRQISTAAAELETLDAQERELREDLARNQDVRRLRDFGSNQSWASDERDCPTCHQPVPPTLLGGLDRPTMTIEQNIGFIEQQIELVEASRVQLAQVLDVARDQQAATRRATVGIRSEIRALRQSLVRVGGVPSTAEIQRRLLLESRRQDLASAEIDVGTLRDELHALSARARENAEAIAALPGSGLSDADEARLRTLQDLFVDQLAQYEPKSLPLADLSISRDSYLPASGGYDLGFDVSASDGIRLIWAYLIGLLETSRVVDTNHLGLVVFDEPRQQSASDRSLRELLHRASTAGGAHQQVLFATSEPTHRLEPILAELACQYMPIEGRLLQPIS